LRQNMQWGYIRVWQANESMKVLHKCPVFLMEGKDVLLLSLQFYVSHVVKSFLAKVETSSRELQASA
jgi:hypothetical protein